MPQAQEQLLRLCVDVVSSYVSHNRVPPGGVADLLKDTHAVLVELTTPKQEIARPSPPVPAIPIRRSVTPDVIYCLEDGKAFKSLRRHLRVTYGMTPDQYREKWNLPRDYPMVAPSYAQYRSNLARQHSLGRALVQASKVRRARGK